MTRCCDGKEIERRGDISSRSRDVALFTGSGAHWVSSLMGKTII
jgi:hypothetical protein